MDACHFAFLYFIDMPSPPSCYLIISNPKLISIVTRKLFASFGY
jgi:hypothetical protein